MDTRIKTALIPWDPNSAIHVQRMYQQRVACGWRCDEVEEWKNKTIRNEKFLYWITLADNLDQREELLAVYTNQYPKENTASTVYNTPREPTNRRFLPIGHVSLELLPEQNQRLQLPSSTIWIMSLYISWALQSAGLGRSAMIAAERLATLPPFNRNMIALDCVQKHFQLADNNFGKPPGYSGGTQTTERTTEEWYARQGYEVVQRVDRGYDWKDPLLEEVVPVPVVYMVKKLS